VKTVLVVDDDKLIRRLVHDALVKRGDFTVLEAEDGLDGVARFMLHAPDVLITDVSMPNSDGLEMLDVLQKGGLLKGVRVVIMSGVLNVSEIKEKHAGKAALLSKPFSLHELYAAVEG
jgi:two-component system chemotaxis response regulator CheY